ncbi:MAG: hypothetical protein IKJ83_05095 [Ruminococcus sp.]|nr:hypothetical protein [Ruminococcus sp.]
MTKRIFALIIAVLMIATVFAACGDKKDDDNKTTTTAPAVITPEVTLPILDGPAAASDALQGSWSVTEEGMEIIYTFNGDGTGTIEMMGMALDITYTIDGSSVTYTMSETGQSESQTLDFAVNGSELTLTDGTDALVLTKKEGHVPATPTEYNFDIDITEPATDANIIATGGNIVGSWSFEESGMEIVYTFNADGTGSIDYAGTVMDLTYTTEGNTVTYTATFEGESETETLYYSVVGNELTMTDGEYPVTFTKK